MFYTYILFALCLSSFLQSPCAMYTPGSSSNQDSTDVKVSALKAPNLMQVTAYYKQANRRLLIFEKEIILPSDAEPDWVVWVIKQLTYLAKYPNNEIWITSRALVNPLDIVKNIPGINTLWSPGAELNAISSHYTGLYPEAQRPRLSIPDNTVLRETLRKKITAYGYREDHLQILAGAIHMQFTRQDEDDKKLEQAMFTAVNAYTLSEHLKSPFDPKLYRLEVNTIGDKISNALYLNEECLGGNLVAHVQVRYKENVAPGKSCGIALTNDETVHEKMDIPGTKKIILDNTCTNADNPRSTKATSRCVDSDQVYKLIDALVRVTPDF